MIILILNLPESLRSSSSKCVCTFSHVWFFATSRTVACQASLSLAFSRQEHWTGLPFPPRGDLPNPGTEPMSPAFESGFFTTSHLGSVFYFFPWAFSSLPKKIPSFFFKSISNNTSRSPQHPFSVLYFCTTCNALYICFIFSVMRFSIQHMSFGFRKRSVRRSQL